jgi:hypothetical protein
MRSLLFTLIAVFSLARVGFACQPLPEPSPPAAAAQDNLAVQEPIIWPPKPDAKLLAGMWLSPVDDGRQKVLWLRDDESWRTATVIIKDGAANDLNDLTASTHPWHIDRLDDQGSTYAVVLGLRLPARCGQSSSHGLSFSIQRVTDKQIVLRTPGEFPTPVLYQRADKDVAGQIERLVEKASEPNAGGKAKQLQDGIYAVDYEGEGRRVRRSDGAQIILAERLSDHFGEPTMFSVFNDNTRFALNLKGAGPIPAKRSAPYFVVILDGHVLAVASESEPNPDGTMDFGAQVFGAETAKAVEERLKIQARRRTHPGHRLLTTFAPTKDRYHPGEPVTLHMEIKNVGENAVSFRVGGQQRGPRDNQFRFLAYRSGGWGKAVSDSGDPTNFGGISTWQDLKPGEVFRRDVELSHWFDFKNADSYGITGLFELEFFDRTADGSYGETIWEDFAVGQCTVYVQSPPAKAAE